MRRPRRRRKNREPHQQWSPSALGQLAIAIDVKNRAALFAVSAPRTIAYDTSLDFRFSRSFTALRL